MKVKTIAITAAATTAAIAGINSLYTAWHRNQIAAPKDQVQPQQQEFILF